MTKFFHKEIDQVLAITVFAQDGWHLFDCRVDGSACAKVEAVAISEHYEKSLRLWGTYPENYLLAVRKSLPPLSTGLAAVVDLIAASEDESIFAIVGYSDGGLISVSSDILPLQQAAQQADWWSDSFARLREK